MSSKELAEILVKPLRDQLNASGVAIIEDKELDQLELNIMTFLLRKFEEGRHVGRDHDEKK